MRQAKHVSSRHVAAIQRDQNHQEYIGQQVCGSHVAGPVIAFVDTGWSYTYHQEPRQEEQRVL